MYQNQFKHFTEVCTICTILNWENYVFKQHQAYSDNNNLNGLYLRGAASRSNLALRATSVLLFLPTWPVVDLLLLLDERGLSYKMKYYLPSRNVFNSMPYKVSFTYCTWYIHYCKRAFWDSKRLLNSLQMTFKAPVWKDFGKIKKA